jgi:hypothetical protein
MILAMLAAIAVTQRYTADFCPFLICAAALGCAAVEQCGQRTRIASSMLLSVATLWAVALTAAITLHYQGEMVWGAPNGTRERYQHLQRTVDAWFSH